MSDEAPSEVLLREHVVALYAWRWEILLATTLAALAGAMLANGPAEHVATATVIINSETVHITTLPVSMSRRPASSGTATWHQIRLRTKRLPVSRSQRATLGALVHHRGVAEAAADALRTHLGEDERDLATLLDAVSSEPARHRLQERDLITIQATAAEPAKAEAIANAWADAYVREVNRLYGWAPDDDMTAEIGAAISETQAAYTDAQRKLAAFIAASPRESLHQQITELKERLDTRRKASQVLADARSLRARIEKAGETGSASNALAILILKAQSLFASSVSLDLSIEADTPRVGAAEQIADLDVLIESLLERIEQLDGAGTDPLPGGLSDPEAEKGRNEPAPPPRAIRKIEQDIQVLRAELESANVAEEQLRTERDLRRTTLASLKGTEASVRVPSLFPADPVRLASRAILQADSRSSRVATAAGIGAVLGLFASMLLAVAANFLRVQPFFRKRR